MQSYTPRSPRSAAIVRLLAPAAVALVSLLALNTWLEASATAQSAAPAPATIALVDLEKVIAGLREMQDVNTRLAEDAKAKQKSLDEINSQVTSLQAEIDTMKKDDPERRKKIASVLELNAQGKARRELLQQVQSFEQGDALRAIYAKILMAADVIARRDGYDLVLVDDRSIVPPEGKGQEAVAAAMSARRILHANDRLDITQQVLDRMNSDYKP